jgi:general secretion pathway protein J
MTARTPAPLALPDSRGFTLLELLVAMFIAAVIFAMGYGAINQAVKNRVELQEQQKKLVDLQTAMRVIEQDFVQAAPRPVRQPISGGGPPQPALISSTTTQPFVALTRAGWTNPAGVQRPQLQRVAYYFDNGTLRRENWTVLDPTQTSVTVKRELLTHLKSVSLRFMDLNKTWQPQWPAVTRAVNATDPRGRPIAVEVTLETEDWGKIVRIIEIAG